MVSGASIFHSGQLENKFNQGFSFMIHWPLYQLTPEKAVDQFRYWVTTNRHNHELMLTFFNILNDNKLVKEGGKLILDPIATNLKLYLPMLTKELTFAESD